MKISGFTIVKNAIAFDFQVVESIRSMLPLVDEVIVVAGDSTDATNELLASIDSEKVRIINTVWSLEKHKDKGRLFAYQTDLALKECSGDWCLYLQSDEVLHEDGLEPLKKACAKYLNDDRVEGFVLPYIHLWGDYNHYIDALHFAYPREVRVVRRHNDIHSWRDAQSFRLIPSFDYEDYWQKEGTRKLNCVELCKVKVFHYGWSRDPRKMVAKINSQRRIHDPNMELIVGVDYYDYGDMSSMPVFKGSHPKVMHQRIAAIDWLDLLPTDGRRVDNHKIFGTKYRIIGFIEKYLLGNHTIGGFKNYRIIRKEK